MQNAQQVVCFSSSSVQSYVVHYFVWHAPCLCQCLTLPIQRLTAAAGLQDDTPPKLKQRLQSIATAQFSVGKKIAVGVYRSLCCCGSHNNVLVGKASHNHAMQCL